MKRKQRIKMMVDLMMTLLLLMLVGYQLWGEEAHEWAGASMLVLFLLHNLLNRGWYRAMGKGKFPPIRSFQTIVNLLLLVLMGMQMYSGIVMSRHVFAFLPIEGGMSVARRLHILGAYWGFLLMSIHLGMHWNSMIAMAGRLSGDHRKKDGQTGKRSFIPALAGALIAFHGALVFMERDFLTYMFLKSEFVFLDYSEPKLLFYLDYLSLMGLCIFLAHYLSKWLRKMGTAQRKEESNEKRNRSFSAGLPGAYRLQQSGTGRDTEYGSTE